MVAGTRGTAPSPQQRRNRLYALGGAVVAAIIMALWGSSELLSPFPKSNTGACDPTDQLVITTMDRGDVQVSVYNAGASAGTAAKIAASLTKLGFQPGTVGNAPAGVNVETSEVVGPSDSDPATRLVAETLGSSAKVSTDPALQIGPGVNVFIGPRHRSFAKKPPRSIKLPAPITSCVSG